MTDDKITGVVTNILKNMGMTGLPEELIFTMLYNFIPAFIFAPYLINRGLKYKDKIIVLMGISLLIVDTMHFYLAMRRYR